MGEGPYSGGGSVAVGKNAPGKTIWDVGGAWTPSVGDGVVAQGGRSYTWTHPGY